MLKREFPQLRDSQLIYLDSGATTQKPASVIDRLSRYYASENANVHKALYPLGEEASRLYEESRVGIQKFLNASSHREILFTSGTTGALNQLAFSFCETLEEGDRILLTEMEHHGNLVPWQLAAKRRRLELDFIPLGRDYRLDLDWMRRNWSDRIHLVSLTHISNLLGTVNPLKEIIAFAHEHEVPVAVDAAQSAARVPLDVQALDCDFLAFSGHKTYGPTGIGILYGKRIFLERLPPWQGGGDMISSVSLSESTWNELPWKFEAGTPHIAGAIGLAAALDWLDRVGRRVLQDHERELTRYGLEGLSRIEGIDIYGTGEEDQLGVISFNLGGLHAHDVVQFLAAEKSCPQGGPSLRPAFGSEAGSSIHRASQFWSL